MCGNKSVYIFSCEKVCYTIMMPIYKPHMETQRIEKARCTRGTTQRRRQGLQEPTVHSARLRSHWRRVRLCWDASMSLLVRPKSYSSYKRRARRYPKYNLTLSHLIILPVHRPSAQRYRGNDPCHLPTRDNTSGSFKYKYTRRKCETYREVRVHVRIL